MSIQAEEKARVDAGFVARQLTTETRQEIWHSAEAILSHGPLSQVESTSATGLALGYVQSGKTTAITALVAAAADQGYSLIVAILGSTNLLLQQNEERLRDGLQLASREDYAWVHMTNPAGQQAVRDMSTWLTRGRTVLVTVLKNAGRLEALAKVLSKALSPEISALIVDDEADQASMNTKVNEGAESRTYSAIGALRSALPRHLFVQFTATPYAPLLLEPDDHLLPEFVEVLKPGPGYVGGREFFVDYSDVVVRPIPTLDEQMGRSLPTDLPQSLRQAFASFLAGSALLMTLDIDSPPISMLVHSTHRNDVQERYHFLLQRLHKKWASSLDRTGELSDVPVEILNERTLLVDRGVRAISDVEFVKSLIYVLSECTFWLVNSVSAVNRVDWRVAPVHVLVGGNKLDRGFTVEGLTVTYMNRAPSSQVDTLEQRSRAFGYRGESLPFCQFFATPATLTLLRQITDTEYDLRARLQDWLSSGGVISEWSREVGLLLPSGATPSRQAVLGALLKFNEKPRWHQLRRPSRDSGARQRNSEVVTRLGLQQADPVDYGRLAHPTCLLPLRDLISELLEPWDDGGYGQSPGWRGRELIDVLSRQPDQDLLVPILLMRRPEGGPREREWDSELGFVNLFQGADPRQSSHGGFYPGDRLIAGVGQDADAIVAQVHWVTASNVQDFEPIFTLALHAGGRQIVKRG